MGKVGFSKPQHSSKKGIVKHAFVNGPAYEIDNPAQKLIHTIGCFFSEPSYYDQKTNKDGLTEQAKGVVEAAKALANHSIEDLLIIAAWARDVKEGLKLRTTPQVLFSVAATHNSELLPKYVNKIMTRADDIRTAFATYNALFVKTEKRTLPSRFKKSLAVALANQSVYGLVKYNSDNHPTFRDVIAMVKSSKNIDVVKDSSKGYPLSKGLYEYLCFGKVTDDAPAIIQKRSEFFKNKDINKLSYKDVEDAGLTWENVLSQFGNSADVWRLCLSVMGEMALTRNLRNFEQANFSSKEWDIVERSLLFDKNEPRKTVQLPFRFLAAYNHISTSRAKTIVAKAFDLSIASVPELPGKSVVFSDNSGSMSSPLSVNSEMKMVDAANSLGAILSKRNAEGCDMYVFADHVKEVQLNTCDSGITLLNNIQTAGRYAGCGTNIDEVELKINEYRHKKISVNRFIILSDMCCYHYGYRRNPGGLQRAFDEYRRVVNKDCYLYSVNLAGHGQAQVKPEDNQVVIMSGWSENIFKLMLDAENGSRSEQINTILPTMDELRLKYKVN